MADVSRSAQQVTGAGDEPWHGTMNGYTNRACRCADCKQAQRAYYRKNADKRRAYQQQYFAENRERYRELGKRWRSENPAAHSDAFKRWAEENAEHRREYQKRWNQENAHMALANNERRRSRKRNADHGCVTASAVIIPEGALCAYCALALATDVEHMNPLSLGGLHCLSNITFACASCNSSKRAMPLGDWLRKIDMTVAPTPIGVCAD